MQGAENPGARATNVQLGNDRQGESNSRSVSMDSLSEVSTNRSHPIKSYADSNPSVEEARTKSGTVFHWACCNLDLSRGKMRNHDDSLTCTSFQNSVWPLRAPRSHFKTRPQWSHSRGLFGVKVAATLKILRKCDGGENGSSMFSLLQWSFWIGLWAALQSL